jgi:two-component system, response regulator PdtaR
MAAFSILLAQTQPILVVGLDALLKSLGHVPAGLASTGEEAIAAAASHSPDFTLMDVALDGSMDGIEAAWEIHARFAIRTLFFSRVDDRATRARARAVKPLGFLPHSASRSRLELAISKVPPDARGVRAHPGAQLTSVNYRSLRRN